MADFTADLKSFYDVFVIEDLAANFTPNCTVQFTMFWTLALSFRSTMFLEVRLVGDPSTVYIWKL